MKSQSKLKNINLNNLIIKFYSHERLLSVILHFSAT